MPGIGISGGRFACDSSVGGSSLSVALSDSSPKLDETITITVTPTGITPTSYTFFLPKQDGTFDEVTQASSAYDWKVKKYDAFEVTVTATDGSLEATSTVIGTTSGDVDADAFITAHNSATGGTMDATMEANTLGFFLRLKGINTTFYEDVFAQLSAADAEIYPCIPDDVSGASVSGYSINAIDPTNNATMVGFVASDATVNGLTGGSGKYMIMNNAPSDYGQNDVGIDAYIRGNSTAVPIGGGEGDANDNTSGISIFSGFSSNRIIVKCNSEDYLTLSSVSKLSFNTGFVSVQRNKSDRFNPSHEGDDFDVIGLPSLTPSNQPFYGMAMNNNGTPARNYTDSASCFINRPYLEECALKTLAEAVDWLQTQIARNV